MCAQVLNDVNACYGDNGDLLKHEVFKNISNNLAPTMARYGITPYVCACFGAPTVMSNLTSDPKSDIAQKWWSEKSTEIWRDWPTFGGFLVKADSEGNIGPLTYNRTEAGKSSSAHPHLIFTTSSPNHHLILASSSLILTQSSPHLVTDGANLLARAVAPHDGIVM